ncbi:MAG: SDR family oxidoreductase [Hyphomicrobiales bacterium]|nr:SDR family oxidoreductase [Hyphomicrobiales bacterium]
MKVAGKIIVVTGGADGIGKALCERFHREGARKIVVVDRNAAGAEKVAASVNGIARVCDVSREEDIRSLVEETEKNIGPIALFVSNAGIGDFGGDMTNVASQPTEQWMRGWGVNVMAHVYAARACLPHMLKRGEGYFLNTASAAGLLNQIGNACYGVTKHAAVGFAEILAITHRDQGIRVSVLCPQAVDTPLLRLAGEGPQNVDGVLSPEQVAQDVIEALDQDTFLVLPHKQVLDYMRAKTANYDRWIGGMAKFARLFKKS